MLCAICDAVSERVFTRTVLAKYPVAYFQCGACGFIQTESPYWLEEAYRHSINIEDTGIVKRNILAAKRTSAVLGSFFGVGGIYADMGGGYGLFVRLMRDYGFDFYWSDPYTQNLFARGLGIEQSHANAFDAITSFECFEHFVNPLKEIEQLLEYSRTVIFSTQTFSGKAPEPDRWDYYHFSHGQHIALYSIASLEIIARKHGLRFYTNGKSFHLFTEKKLNRTLFSLVLKLATLGLPAFISLAKGSKTHSDSQAMESRRIAKKE